MTNQLPAQEEKPDQTIQERAPSGCSIVFLNGAFALAALSLFGAILSAFDNSMQGGFRAWLTIFFTMGLILLANIAGIIITRSQKDSGSQAQLLKFLLYGNGITFILLLLFYLLKAVFRMHNNFHMQPCLSCRTSCS